MRSRAGAPASGSRCNPATASWFAFGRANGRIDAEQAAGIAELAERYCNGLIELTNRANLQIRGLREDNHSSLIDGLARLRLLDPDPDTEARRNILITPFWDAGDEVITIAGELERALANGPLGLPAKFGFAVDCGNERVLAGASADVRIERDIDGQFIVRADGAELGRAVSRNEAVTAALGLAEWFVAQAAQGRRGRMAAHHHGWREAAGNTWRSGEAGARHAHTPDPGLTPHGATIRRRLRAIDFRRAELAGQRRQALRMTPWRMILAEGMSAMPACEGVITRADDSLLRVVACSGAPRCREAHADTRALAAALAPHLAAGARLHVSGCTKGCAQSDPASITLVATGKGFDLIRGGSTQDTPVLRGLSADGILANPSILSGRTLMLHHYETDGAAIYRQSFAIIRAEADLARFSADEEPVVVRMIHAAGMVGLEAHSALRPGMAGAARAALQRGAPILCDARMVSEGITRARLPAHNAVICTLDDPTRSCARASHAQYPLGGGAGIVAAAS